MHGCETPNRSFMKLPTAPPPHSCYGRHTFTLWTLRAGIDSQREKWRIIASVEPAIPTYRLDIVRVTLEWARSSCWIKDLGPLTSSCPWSAFAAHVCTKSQNNTCGLLDKVQHLFWHCRVFEETVWIRKKKSMKAYREVFWTQGYPAFITFQVN